MTVQVKQAIGILLWQALMLTMLIGLASWVRDISPESTQSEALTATLTAVKGESCRLEAAAAQAFETLNDLSIEPTKRQSARLFDIGPGW